MHTRRSRFLLAAGLVAVALQTHALATQCPPSLRCPPGGPPTGQNSCCCEADTANDIPELGTTEVVCPIKKDGRLMEAHINNNTGIESETHFKRGNGRDRVLVAFDLTSCKRNPDDPEEEPIELPSDIVSARIRMAAWASPGRSNFTADGVWVGVYHRTVQQDPSWAGWTEGLGRWDKFFDQPATDPPVDPLNPKGGEERFGPGNSWNCRSDDNIANGIKECATGLAWDGGDLSCTVGAVDTFCEIAEYSGSTLIDEADAISTCCHPPHNSQGRVVASNSACEDKPGVTTTEPASCYIPEVMDFRCRWTSPGGGTFEVDNLVDLAEWTVTGAVQDALPCSGVECLASFLITKNQEQGANTAGKIKYYTREGAAYWSDTESSLILEQGASFSAASAAWGPPGWATSHAYPQATELAPRLIVDVGF